MPDDGFDFVDVIVSSISADVVDQKNDQMVARFGGICILTGSLVNIRGS